MNTNKPIMAGQSSDLIQMLLRPAPINTIEDYEFCRNTRLYLRRCAEKTGIEFAHFLKTPAPIMLEAMRHAGYAQWQKFYQHVCDWHDLTRRIPRSYAQFIGVKEDVLQTVVEFDLENFEQAATLPLRPRYFVLHLIAFFNHTYRFPDNLVTEEECVQYAVRCLHEHGSARWLMINFRDLKTTYVRQMSNCRDTIWYRPELKITKTHLVFAKDGREEGTFQLRGVRTPIA